jgi:hypothetical protein
MENDIYINKCCAIKKVKPLPNDPNYKLNLRCKSNKQHNSIFCGVHKKHRPDNVAIIIQTINNNDNNDNNNNNNINNREWLTIPITKKTKEDEIIIQIKKTKDNFEKENLDKIIKEAEILNAITKCKVCFEDLPINSELIRCTKSTSENKHLVCNECMLGHINSLISDGTASYTCMFNKSDNKIDNCCGEYKTVDINKVINNPEKQAKWEELINISEIFKLASICDDYLICPLCCKWGCIFETPPGYNGNFYIPCGKCNERWCNICKRKSHSDRSCYKLEFNKDENIDNKIELIDRMIQELVTKSLTHCCSTCGCSYIKEEGCNLMVCPKCNSMTCYLCNMKLYYKNNTKYWHFQGHDLSDPDAQCKLWNNMAGDGKINQGNTEFNENIVKKELKNFISVNIDSIAALICNRIIYIFEKDKEYQNIVLYFKLEILKNYTK